MDARQASCRRRVLACARCRKQKIKCDREDPCRNCRESRSACTGYSSVAGGINVPKSIVASLEARLAQMSGLGRSTQPEAENRHVNQGTEYREEQNSENNNASASTMSRSASLGDRIFPETATATTSFQAARQDSIVASTEIQAVIAAFSPGSASINDEMSGAKMGLTPSLAAQRQSPRSYNDSISIHYLSKLPKVVLSGLVRKYVYQILPTYPCLYGPRLLEQLETVFNRLQVLAAESITQIPAPDADMFFVYMTIAVAANSPVGAGIRDGRRESLARSLFEEGLQHWSRSSFLTEDLTRVQAMLVVLQYALIDPAAASVWMLSGAAVRLCVAFGLHRETTWSFAFDDVEVEMRRRVFWTAYYVDRMVSAATQRPLSVPDAVISTEVPAGLNRRSPYTVHSTEPDRMDPKYFRNWIAYSSLQSQLLQYHLQKTALPTETAAPDWFAMMEQKIADWHAQSSDSDGVSGVAKARLLVNLHRPSPQSPRPNDDSLLKAYKASVVIANYYKTKFRSKLVLSAWQAAHDLLGMSTIVLICLRHAFHHVRSEVGSISLLEETKIFTIDLVSLAEQGWPELLVFARTYERLLNRLLEPILSSDESQGSNFSAGEDAELSRLLHLGSSQVEKQRDEVFAARFESNFNFLDFSFEDWMTEDINDFQVDV